MFILQRNSLGGCGHLLITLESHGIFLSIFVYLYILHCLDTGMRNDDEALMSISLACHGQLVKMLITLQPHGIFH